MTRTLRSASAKANALQVALHPQQSTSSLQQSASRQSTRVCIRIKPGKCLEDGLWSINAEEKSIGLSASNRKVHGKRAAPEKSFRFDSIIGPNDTTSNLYKANVAESVQAALEGFNSTIFAYGRTSSGKTHTMMGTSAQPGVIVQAVGQIFSFIAATPGSQYSLRLRFVEVYNETINDLLRIQTSSGLAKDLKVVSEHNNVWIEGAVEKQITCADDILGALAEGDRARHSQKTDFNAHSSRSHAIVTITIEHRLKEAGNATYISQLNFVDLAGSEKPSEGQKEANEQLNKEGSNIRLSLFNLTSVLQARSKSNSLKPEYRSSKLTWLLKPSLEGNARVVFVCTISSEDDQASITEGLSTLTLAQTVKTIVIKPQKQEIEDAKSMLAKACLREAILQRDLQRIKEQTEELRVQETSETVRDQEQSAVATGDVIGVADVDEEKEAMRQDILNLKQKMDALEREQRKKKEQLQTVSGVILTGGPAHRSTSASRAHSMPANQVKQGALGRGRPPFNAKSACEDVTPATIESEEVASLSRTIEDKDAEIASLKKAMRIEKTNLQSERAQEISILRSEYQMLLNEKEGEITRLTRKEEELQTVIRSTGQQLSEEQSINERLQSAMREKEDAAALFERERDMAQAIAATKSAECESAQQARLNIEERLDVKSLECQQLEASRESLSKGLSILKCITVILWLVLRYLQPRAENLRIELSSKSAALLNREQKLRQASQQAASSQEIINALAASLNTSEDDAAQKAAKWDNERRQLEAKEADLQGQLSRLKLQLVDPGQEPNEEAPPLGIHCEPAEFVSRRVVEAIRQEFARLKGIFVEKGFNYNRKQFMEALHTMDGNNTEKRIVATACEDSALHPAERKKPLTYADPTDTEERKRVCLEDLRYYELKEILRSTGCSERSLPLTMTSCIDILVKLPSHEYPSRRRIENAIEVAAEGKYEAWFIRMRENKGNFEQILFGRGGRKSKKN